MMKLAAGILGVSLAVASSGPSVWGQTGDNLTAEKAGAASRQDLGNSRVDLRPYQVFYLSNALQVSDANEVVNAVRNVLPPDVKVYLAPSQNAIVMRGNADEIALAQKVINDLDRPKKTFRLTYTITEVEGGKRIGVQHYAMIVTAGQRTVMKQGSKMPIVTGESTEGSSTKSFVTFIDIGMNFDATLEQYANGARLRTKVEQLSVADEKSGVGPQDPIVRQTSLEGTSFLTLGKPVVLGSLDVPGSTRHLDVDVMMEAVP